QLHMAEADLIRANAARYAVEQGYCESIAACDEGTVGRAAGELTLQALRQTDLTGENLPHNQAAAAFLAGIAPRGLIPGLCAPGSALCQQRWFEAVLYDEYKDSTINRQFFAYASDLYRLASNFYNQHHLTPDDLGYRLGQTVQGIDSIRQVMANGDRTMLPWELFTALAGGFGGPFAARLKAPKPQSPGTVATGGQGDKSGGGGTGRSPWTQVSSDARAVVRDIEAHSGVQMPSSQREHLAGELRQFDHTYVATRDTYQALQREYNRQRNNLKRDWELNTGQKWPKTENGVDFQAHHVIPQQYGGPNQWWNLHPVPGGSAHQGGVHGVGSPTSTAFPQHPPRSR
ncbi:HNH endonuclease, partial [Pannonibacter phragmitetus]